jgi:hypothetical protein
LRRIAKKLLDSEAPLTAQLFEDALFNHHLIVEI